MRCEPPIGRRRAELHVATKREISFRPHELAAADYRLNTALHGTRRRDPPALCCVHAEPTVTAFCCARLNTVQSCNHTAYGPITIAIRARFEYDSTTIRLQHATTRYEVFRALAYEIVYENQW